MHPEGIALGWIRWDKKPDAILCSPNTIKYIWLSLYLFNQVLVYLLHNLFSPSFLTYIFTIKLSTSTFYLLSFRYLRLCSWLSFPFQNWLFIIIIYLSIEATFPLTPFALPHNFLSLTCEHSRSPFPRQISKIIEFFTAFLGVQLDYLCGRPNAEWLADWRPSVTCTTSGTNTSDIEKMRTCLLCFPLSVCRLLLCLSVCLPVFPFVFINDSSILSRRLISIVSTHFFSKLAITLFICLADDLGLFARVCADLSVYVSLVFCLCLCVIPRESSVFPHLCLFPAVWRSNHFSFACMCWEFCLCHSVAFFFRKCV